MPKQLLAEIIKKDKILPGVFKFTVKAEEIVEDAKPGNFIEIRVSNQVEPFLRRPISIYNLDREDGTLEFIFQVKGKGTEILSKKEKGDKIDIIGPLGHGIFSIDNYSNIAIIGGGIGIFPLFELAKEAYLEKKKVNTYLGFRNKECVMLEKEFQNISDKITIRTANTVKKLVNM